MDWRKLRKITTEIAVLWILNRSRDLPNAKNNTKLSTTIFGELSKERTNYGVARTEWVWNKHMFETQSSSDQCLKVEWMEREQRL